MKRVSDLSNEEVEVYLNKLTIQEKRQLLMYYVRENKKKKINVYTDPCLYKDVLHIIAGYINVSTYATLRASCKKFYEKLPFLHPTMRKVINAFENETNYKGLKNDLFYIKPFLIRYIVLFMKQKGVRDLPDLQTIPVSYLSKLDTFSVIFNLNKDIYITGDCFSNAKSQIFPILELDIEKYLSKITPNWYIFLQRSKQKPELKHHSDNIIKKLYSFYENNKLWTLNKK